MQEFNVNISGLGVGTQVVEEIMTGVYYTGSSGDFDRVSIVLSGTVMNMTVDNRQSGVSGLPSNFTEVKTSTPLNVVTGSYKNSAQTIQGSVTPKP